MEVRRFCLFVPVRREGYRIVRKGYAVDGGILSLEGNILGERGKAYLFDGEVRFTVNGEETEPPVIEPGAVVILGEPQGECLGETDTLPEGEKMKVSSVSRKNTGSRRMHHTVLTLR